MPSPIAHIGLSWAILGAVAPTVRGRDLALVAFAAVLPDLDLVPDLLSGGGIAFHHGPTHSVLFAVVAGLSLGARSPRWLGGVVLAALLIHAPLDYTTGEPGAPSRYGVELLWPLSDTRFISADPFFGAYHIDRPGGLVHMFTAEALPPYERELGVALAAGVAAAGWRLVRARRRSRARSPAP